MSNQEIGIGKTLFCLIAFDNFVLKYLYSRRRIREIVSEWIGCATVEKQFEKLS